MRRTLALLAPIALAFSLTACANDEATVTPAEEESVATEDATDDTETATEEEAAADSAVEEDTDGESFVDGVLTTPAMTIRITDHRVIPVGEPGNEYGDGPVLAFWFDITNNGGGSTDVTPLSWISVFDAYQDNDPNVENKLSVGMAPDSELTDNQMAKIKVGGTTQGAVAYDLDDETTPVELVARLSLFDDEPLGTETFQLQ